MQTFSSISKLSQLFVLPLLIAFIHLESGYAQETLNPNRGFDAWTCVQEQLYTGFSFDGQMEIGPQHYVRSSAIIANEIHFGPESKLFIADMRNRQSQSFGKSSSNCPDTFYIIADRLVIEGNDSASITWSRTEIDSVPPDRGRAGSGPSGVSAGQNGRNGFDGAPGNVGYSGEDAPSLIMVAKEIVGGRLTIDLTGQKGGKGGKGQAGGHGGSGNSGTASKGHLFTSCKRQAGSGGAGGNGGGGGPGGVGGDGGQGGVFLLISSLEVDPYNFFRVDVSGGAGGAGGDAGEKGAPGKGGLGGRAIPPCPSSGRQGPEGEPGPPGEPGQKGRNGPNGDFLYQQLHEDQFLKLFMSGK